MAKNSDSFVEMLDPFEMMNGLNDGSDKNAGADPNDDDIIVDPDPDDDENNEGEEVIVDSDKTPVSGKSNKPAESDDFTNPLAIHASQWKQDGRLPEDFKITDDITEEQIDRALYDYKVNGIVAEKLEEFKKEHGLSDDIIAASKAKNLGIDPQLYKSAKAYKTLSEIELDQDDDNYEKDLTEYLTLYYKDLGTSEKKITRMVEDDITSDDLEDTLKEVKSHFKKKGLDTTKSIQSKEAEARDRAQKNKEQKLEFEKSLLKSKNIAGKEITDEQSKFLEKALYEKTETIKLKDGNSVRVTLYDKMIHEAMSDKKKAFLSKVNFMLQFQNGESPVEAATKGLLKNLSKAIGQQNKAHRAASADVEILN